MASSAERIYDAECPICQSAFETKERKPLMLIPCGHNVCEECHGVMVHDAKINLHHVECPTCRRKAENHAVNWQLMNLVEKTSSIQEKQQKTENKLKTVEKTQRVAGPKPQRTVRPETVFVQNLPTTATKEDLQHLFSAHARIASTQDGETNLNRIIIYNDKESGRQLDKCMVTFVNEAAAKSIIKKFDQTKFPGSENVLSLTHGLFATKDDLWHRSSAGGHVEARNNSRNNNSWPIRGGGRGRGGNWQANSTFNSNETGCCGGCGGTRGWQGGGRGRGAQSRGHHAGCSGRGRGGFSRGRRGQRSRGAGSN